MLDQTMDELREYVKSSKTNYNRESKTGNKDVESLSFDELMKILEEDTIGTEELNEVQYRSEKAVENDGESQSCCNVLEPEANDIEGVTVEVRENFFSRMASSLSMNYKTLFHKQGSVCLTESNICEIAKKMEYGILSTAKDRISYFSLGAEAVINIVKQTCNQHLCESLHNEIELFRLREQMPTSASEDAQEVQSIFTADTQPYTGQEVQSSFTTDIETFSKNHQEALDISSVDTEPFIRDETFSEDHQEELNISSADTEPYMCNETFSEDHQDELNISSADTEPYMCNETFSEDHQEELDITSADTEPYIYNESQDQDHNQSNTESMVAETLNNKPINSPDSQNNLETEYYSCSSDSCFFDAESNSKMGTVNDDIHCKNNNNIEKVTDEAGDEVSEIPSRNDKKEFNSPSTYKDSQKGKRKRKLECASESSMICLAIHQNEVSVDSRNKQKQTENVPASELPDDNTTVTNSNKVENSKSHLVKYSSEVTSNKDGRDIQDPHGNLPGEKELEEMESIVHKSGNYIEKVADEPSEIFTKTSSRKNEFDSASTNKSSQKNKRKRNSKCDMEPSSNCSTIQQNEVSVSNPKKKRKQTESEPAPELPADDTIVSDPSNVENSEFHLKDCSEETSDKDKNPEETINVDNEISPIEQRQTENEPTVELPAVDTTVTNNNNIENSGSNRKDCLKVTLEKGKNAEKTNATVANKISQAISSIMLEPESNETEPRSPTYLSIAPAFYHFCQKENATETAQNSSNETADEAKNGNIDPFSDRKYWPDEVRLDVLPLGKAMKIHKQLICQVKAKLDLSLYSSRIDEQQNIDQKFCDNIPLQNENYKSIDEVFSNALEDSSMLNSPIHENSKSIDKALSNTLEGSTLVPNPVHNSGTVHHSPRENSNPVDEVLSNALKDTSAVPNSKQNSGTVRSCPHEKSSLVDEMLSNALEDSTTAHDPISYLENNSMPSVHTSADSNKKTETTTNAQNSSNETTDESKHCKIDSLSDKKYWPGGVKTDDQVVSQLNFELDLSQYSLRIDDEQNIDQKFWDNIPLQNENYKSIDEVFSNVLIESTLVPNPVHNSGTVQSFSHENSSSVDEVLSNALEDSSLMPNPVYNPESVHNSPHEISSPVDEVLSNALEGSTTALSPIPYLENATLPSVDTSTDSNKKTETTKNSDYCPIDDETFALYEARLVKLSEELKSRLPEVDEKNDDDVIHDEYKKSFGIILPIIRKYYPSEYLPNDSCYGQVLQRLQIDLADADNASDDELAKYVEDSIKDRRYLLDNCIVG